MCNGTTFQVNPTQLAFEHAGLCDPQISRSELLLPDPQLAMSVMTENTNGLNWRNRVKMK